MSARRRRVGLLATHPIQYYAPWYRALADVFDLRVFYCHRQTPQDQAAAGFGVAFDWDLSLLHGYHSQFLRNRALQPNASTFFGCDTPDIVRIIRRERFDAFVVHGWATKAYWQAILACWQTGTPVLVRGDSQLSLTGSFARRVAKYPIYRWFIPRFDGYLVVGERARQYYLRYGADPRRMFAAPHAVDNTFFATEAARQRTERTPLRRTLGLPDSGVVWLFAGKLVDRKRPGDFMQAISTAARAHSRVCGLVAGDGPIRAELQHTAQQEGWPVRFAGFLNQTQMPAAYAASDALVLPSDGRETWGLVVNEAMASGLPAVVSDEVGSAPDLVHQGQTGEVFRCGDVGQLASIVARLSADPSHLEQMGRRAQRHVENYSIARAAAGTAAAVDAIMRTRCRGGVK